MTGALLAMALQVLTAPTLPRWLEFTGRHGEQFALDPQSITRSGNGVSVIVRARVRDGEGPAVGVLRYRYDCAANTVIREVGDVYDGSGRFLGTITTPQPSRTIPPDSLHAGIRDQLCRTAAQ